MQQEVADSTEEKFSNQPLNKEHVSIGDNVNSQAIGGADKDGMIMNILLLMSLLFFPFLTHCVGVLEYRGEYVVPLYSIPTPTLFFAV